MATVTLYPAGAGNETNLTNSGGSANWDSTNEVGADDGDTTYVVNANSSIFKRDLYTIDANSIGASDTINSITVYNVCRTTATGRLLTFLDIRTIRENSTTTDSSSNSITIAYATYSTTWTVKPSNGAAFTKTDIDNLEIGTKTLASGGCDVRTTQVYVIVDYTPAAPPAGEKVQTAGD